jgi:hypothetical protein
VEPEELAGAIVRLVQWAERHAPRPGSPLRRRLREHFAVDPAELPVVSRSLEAWDRPNVQVALDLWLAGKVCEVVGVSVMDTRESSPGRMKRRLQYAIQRKRRRSQHPPPGSLRATDSRGAEVVRADGPVRTAGQLDVPTGTGRACASPRSTAGHRGLRPSARPRVIRSGTIALDDVVSQLDDVTAQLEG